MGEARPLAVVSWAFDAGTDVDTGVEGLGLVASLMNWASFVTPEHGGGIELHGGSEEFVAIPDFELELMDGASIAALLIFDPIIINAHGAGNNNTVFSFAGTTEAGDVTVIELQIPRPAYPSLSSVSRVF